MTSTYQRIIALAVFGLGFGLNTTSFGQTKANTPPTPPPPPQGSQPAIPLTTTVKKTVAFLTTSCVHDFSVDASKFPPTQPFTLEQRFAVISQIGRITQNLLSVPVIFAKTSPDERTYLQTAINEAPSMSGPQITQYVLRALSDFTVMTTLSDGDVSKLTDYELSKIPSDDVLGTGFFVHVPDDRIPVPASEVGPMGFLYLVTNRHVAQPGAEKGQPCRRLGTTILLNHKPDSTHAVDYTERDRIDKLTQWFFPDDESVDLAASPVYIPTSLIDYVPVPATMFVTGEDVDQHKIVEGDPVFFAGLFI